jgi:sugar/nucleoside kinase (ribokinase family)
VTAAGARFDVVGVGTNSVDHVFIVPGTVASIVGAGKARVSARQILCGGQTATAVCATAALGLRSGYAGAFGSNAEGKLISSTLQRCGVDITHTTVCAGPNREAIILVDAHGMRTVLWHRNESLTIAPDCIRAAVAQARLVHVDDDDPETTLAAVQSARDASVPTTSDIEHATELTERLISGVTYPILDEDLPGTLTGEGDPERALRKLRRLNSGVLCMTMGELGAAALEGDTFHVSPAFHVKATDTTGAGDVFRAGFMYGVLQKWTVPEILRFANATAAVSCTRLGAIPSVPTLAEVRSLLAQRA